MEQSPQAVPVALWPPGCRCVAETGGEFRRNPRCPFHGDGRTPQPIKCSCKVSVGGREGESPNLYDIARDPACPLHGDYFPAPIACHSGAERRGVRRRLKPFDLPPEREDRKGEDRRQAHTDPEIRLLVDQALTLGMGLSVAIDALTGKVTPTPALLLRLRELVENGRTFFAGKWPK